MDVTKILTREEVQRVLHKLHSRVYCCPSSQSISKLVNLVVFRLSCCCGLRAKEISGLNLGDMVLSDSYPLINIRKEITKGREGKRKGRKVPLWWDAGTLKDLKLWQSLRYSNGATPSDPFVCSVQGATTGKRIYLRGVGRKWDTAIQVLGKARASQLSVHCGRHSFVSHALFMGRSLVEVRDAAGHASVNMTSRYAHYLSRENVPDVFGFPNVAKKG